MSRCSTHFGPCGRVAASVIDSMVAALKILPEIPGALACSLLVCGWSTAQESAAGVCPVEVAFSDRLMAVPAQHPIVAFVAGDGIEDRVLSFAPGSSRSVNAPASLPVGWGALLLVADAMGRRREAALPSVADCGGRVGIDQLLRHVEAMPPWYSAKGPGVLESTVEACAGFLRTADAAGLMSSSIWCLHEIETRALGRRVEVWHEYFASSFQAGPLPTHQDFVTPPGQSLPRPVARALRVRPAWMQDWWGRAVRGCLVANGRRGNDARWVWGEGRGADAVSAAYDYRAQVGVLAYGASGDLLAEVLERAIDRRSRSLSDFTRSHLGLEGLQGDWLGEGLVLRVGEAASLVIDGHTLANDEAVTIGNCVYARFRGEACAAEMCLRRVGREWQGVLLWYCRGACRPSFVQLAAALRPSEESR